MKKPHEARWDPNSNTASLVSFNSVPVIVIIIIKYDKKGRICKNETSAFN